MANFIALWLLKKYEIHGNNKHTSQTDNCPQKIFKSYLALMGFSFYSHFSKTQAATVQYEAARRLDAIVRRKTGVSLISNQKAMRDARCEMREASVEQFQFELMFARLR